MTENEAIKWIEAFKKTYNGFPKESELACGIAISALKEIRKYRKCGTLEELARAKKYIDLAKKHGTIGEMIDECASYEEIGTVKECRELASIVNKVERNELAKIIDEWISYRKIGTVEDCREAMEKQKAKKCDVTKDNFRIYYKCPTCNHCLRVEYNHGSWMGKKSKNCSKCGQAIQWDENLEGMEDE